MNLNLLKKLYTSSPKFIKEIYSLIPYDMRNGNEYRNWVTFLNNTKINEKEYQLRKLKETLLYAYNNVPFYRELYDEEKINIEKINSFDDFEKIPIIDTQMIKTHYDKFLSGKDIKKFHVATGGTSGTPMTFWQSTNVWKKELAFVNNYFGKFGYMTKDLKATFRSGSNNYNNLEKDIYWQANPINNEVLFSPFHINVNTIERYIDKLNELNPNFFHGYPSALCSLVNCANEKKIKLNFEVKAVFIVSENYFDEQIKLLKNFFGCKIFTFYGMSERVIFAPAIDDNLLIYRPNQFYGYTELINEDLLVIKENNKNGELIGTGFDNYAMPLIRYRLGDITSYSNYENTTFNKIEGRWKQEFLLGKYNIDISLTALNIHSPEFDNVINSQFYQKEKGKVILRIMVNSKFTNKDAKAIEAALTKKAGHALDFDIEIVDNLILTHRGKIKNIVKDYHNT
ncbi:capsular polysaccharide biosynthesis protein CapK [Bacteroidia bacterium]|nr:capsular polysaccharide biosynthesis protein CapK [Bacteroidia bacterium]GHV70279.1 capsular polysaccharide biosynthesis protein CapK [Bacteroidia bacterium]